GGRVMVALNALDARNPTAYLAALGALRLLEDAGVSGAALGWRREGAGWYRALVAGDSLRGPDDVVEAILRAHAARDLAAEFGWERDVMAIQHDEALEALDRAGSLRALRLVGASIAELPLSSKGRVPYTPLR